MTLLRDPVSGEPGGYKCDHPGCTVTAPPREEIKAANGLINLGWRCTGGSHFCPEHADVAV